MANSLNISTFLYCSIFLFFLFDARHPVCGLVGSDTASVVPCIWPYPWLFFAFEPDLSGEGREGVAKGVSCHVEITVM